MKKIESSKTISITKKLILLGFIIAILVSCAKDIYVKETNPIGGIYYGTYEIISNFSGAQTTKIQYVYWKFTGREFDCEADTAREGRPPFTCDFYGTYEVQAALEFKQVYSKQNMVCNTDDLPSGIYSITWKYSESEDAPDTLQLVYNNYDPDVDERRIISLWEYVP